MAGLWEARDAAGNTLVSGGSTLGMFVLSQEFMEEIHWGVSVREWFVFGRNFCLCRAWAEVQMGKGRPVWRLL